MKTEKVYRRTRFAVAILAIATGLPCCAQDRQRGGERSGRPNDQITSRADEAVQGAQRSTGGQTEKAGESSNDAAISSHIKADLLNDSLLALSSINVTTIDGVVTLNGIVNSQQAMDRAVAIARRHPNVKSVENNLLIKAPSRI